MGKDKICFGLPGFPAISDGKNGTVSYDFAMSSSDLFTFSGNISEKQRIIFLTATITLQAGTNSYSITFNDVPELLGATNLNIGLLNPIGFSLVGYFLTGSDLSINAIILNNIPGINSFTVIFSVSYTPTQ